MRAILTPTNKHVKPSYLQFDNLDDRREIYHLLLHLSPLRRIVFMERFLAKVHLGPWLSLVPAVDPSTKRLAREAMNDDAKDERLANELWNNIWAVCSSYEDLSLDLALRMLVDMVKKKPR